MRITDPIMDSRNALLDFALAVFDWHHDENDRSQQRLIETTRVAGATTGIPASFQEFAQRIEHQPCYGGTETR